jgi:hypothetical protein
VEVASTGATTETAEEAAVHHLVVVSATETTVTATGIGAAGRAVPGGASVIVVEDTPVHRPCFRNVPISSLWRLFNQTVGITTTGGTKETTGAGNMTATTGATVDGIGIVSVTTALGTVTAVCQSVLARQFPLHELVRTFSSL